MSPLGDQSLYPGIREACSAEARAWSKAEIGIDPAWAIDFFVRFYMDPLARHLPLSGASALECASGFGHAALAFAVAGGSVLGVDRTPARVAHANGLALRMGLSDRARFVVGDIHDLPSGPFDVVVTLQTLEHVPDPLGALAGLGDRAGRALVLSTPNRLFPRDGHDTGLYFAHWLPHRARKRWVSVLRPKVDVLNRFLTPFEIDRALPDFRLATPAYCFADLDEWLDRFPCFFPYTGKGRWLPARAERKRWRVASLAETLSFGRARLLAPMIEGIYLRRRSGALDGGSVL